MTWGLVGRGAELDRLAAVMADPAGRGLLLTGPPGVGKSRLLREGVLRLDPDRHAVLTATANAATASVPLSALIPVLPAPPSGALSTAALLHWATEALRPRDDGRAAVLVIDDAHLLDPVSATAIQHRAHAGHLRILAAGRSGVPLPDPLAALVRDDVLERLTLGPLTGSECAEIAAQLVGGPLDLATAERLGRLSEGNPAMLRDIVGAIMASHDLSRSYGVHRWSGRLVPDARLADLVDSRLGNPTPTERTALELLALGEPLELRLLLDLADPTAVENLEERGLLRVSRSDHRTTAAVAHPLDAVVVRARCPVTRSRRLLRDLADRVEATGGRRTDDAMRVAAWRLEAEEPTDAALLLDAARQAFGRYDLRTALRLAEGAAAAGGEEAAVLLGTLLLLSGQVRRAREVLDACPDPRSVAWLTTSAGIDHWGMRRPGVAAALLDRVPGVDPPGAALLRCTAALMHLYAGELAEADRLAAAVLDDPAAGGAARAVATTVRAQVGALRGAPERAVRAVESVAGPPAADAPAAAWLQMPHARVAAEVARGTALLLAGDLAGATELCAGEFAARVEAGDLRMASGYLTLLAGQAARLRGDVRDALRLARLACAAVGHGGALGVLAHAELAHAAALCGEVTLAARALARGERIAADGQRVFQPWLDQAGYWAQACAGDVARAALLAADLAGRMRAAGLAALELVALHDLARLGGAPTAAARLDDLAPGVQGRLAEAVAGHVAALCEDDPAALLAAARQMSGQGLHLYAAEAAASAVDRMRGQRAGHLADAVTVLHQELALCPGASTPALRVRLPALTDRERQVARLAAVGVSSREIAGQLFLSSRTVDNHLMRVYAKLGIGGRGELAAALRALGERH